MSVSYVVPVWREQVYKRVCKPWVQRQVKKYGAQLIEIRGASSIFAAQEEGRQAAKFQYIMYVHDDVRLIRPMDLTLHIVAAFTRFPGLGLIGPTGKVQRKRVPWWTNLGIYVGHYCRRGNDGELVYQYSERDGTQPFRPVVGNPAKDWTQPRWNKFARAGLVDGFYLIEDRERMNVPWDTETYGENWHGYDMDRCFQAHELGLDVMVPHWLFLHDNAGHAGYKGSDPAPIKDRDKNNRRINSIGDGLWLADLEKANFHVRKKWGLT